MMRADKNRHLPPRVVITGFMAAGKTTVALALARLLDDSVIDLDRSVTTIEGRTPRDLIDEKGEEYFREAETRALQYALELGTARIIATGGGTWTLERNRTLIHKSGCLSVWLDAPFELCWQRIEAAGDTRPLARSRESARRLYDERLDAYALAKFHLPASEDWTAEELAREIAAVLLA